jgi:Domain of unknown function (DUF1844)
VWKDKDMSDSPKFEVIDRRKYKAEEEEREAAQTPAPASAPAAVAAPEPVKEEPRVGPQLVTESSREDALAGDELESEHELPPAPTAEETREQKFAYDASAQRLEDLVRAQNPGVGPQPAVTFDHLVNQLYVSAMIQMGAGTQEGQRPRVDILGARQTIDLMGVLAEKTKGNLTEAEDRTLQSVLYEVRMAFLELTNMISLQSMQPPAPPPGKR